MSSRLKVHTKTISNPFIWARNWSQAALNQFQNVVNILRDLVLQVGQLRGLHVEEEVSVNIADGIEKFLFGVVAVCISGLELDACLSK